MADDRTEIAPTWFSYREIPEDLDEIPKAFADKAKLQHKDGARWFRYTIVSDDYPMPPHPNGLYVEGWADPMGAGTKEAPFSFPLGLAEQTNG